MKREEIPVWRKYSLSVQEAAVYFGIGEKRLREFIAYGLSLASSNMYNASIVKESSSHI